MHIVHKKKLGLAALSLGEYSGGYGFDSPPKQIFSWSFTQPNRNSKSSDLLWHLLLAKPSEKVYI
jgi:hypothetical protein